MRLNSSNLAVSKPSTDYYLWCAIIFGITFMLYWLTLGPTFSWGDHADLPHRVVDWDDNTFYFARTYWLYRIVAQPFLWLPFGDVAYRLNLMTAVFGAATVTLVFHLVHQRTQDKLSALGAAIALALSHTLWFLSVIAEVYTLATFLLCIVLATSVALQKAHPKAYELAAFGAALGIFLSHHFAAVLLFPVAGLLLLRFLNQPKMILAFLVALLLGSSLFIFQFVQTWLAFGWAGIQDTFQTNHLGLYRSNWMREAVLFIAYLCYQFPGIGVVAGFGWLLAAPKLIQRRDLFLLGVMVTLIVWGVTNPIPDKFNAYVFFYPMFAILIGMGLHVGLQWSRRQAKLVQWRAWFPKLTIAAIIASPVLLYVVTPSVCGYLGIDLVKARSCPNRNNDTYFLQPWKHGDEGARRYATEALAAAEPNAMVIVDYTLWRPMLYLQRVEGVRNDVSLVWVEPLLKEGTVVEFIQTNIDERPIYLAAITPPHYYDLEAIQSAFQTNPRGSLHRLIAKQALDQVRLQPKD